MKNKIRTWNKKKFPLKRQVIVNGSQFTSSSFLPLLDGWEYDPLKNKGEWATAINPVDMKLQNWQAV